MSKAILIWFSSYLGYPNKSLSNDVIALGPQFKIPQWSKIEPTTCNKSQRLMRSIVCVRLTIASCEPKNPPLVGATKKSRITKNLKASLNSLTYFPLVVVESTQKRRIFNTKISWHAIGYGTVRLTTILLQSWALKLVELGKPHAATTSIKV